MKANEINLNKFLSQADTQFVIPVYQRNYEWTHSQCKQLIDDILEAGTNKNVDAHFIGSIVYVHDDVYSVSGISELTIIDGQQRITTLTLIYLVLHRLTTNINDKLLAARINETYLINKFSNEEIKLKLRPTENNNKALESLLNNNDTGYLEYSRLIENFHYFNSRISEENYEVVIEGLKKLMFVEISLDRHKDDPQRIFESLNSTGLELSQADLIRNYILMGLNRNDQNHIYKNYWEYIERLAKDDTTHSIKLSDFIRDYLTLVNKKIPNKNKVYQEFKTKYPITNVAELEQELEHLKTLVKYYNKILNPKNETDNDIRIQLIYINRLEINVAYPFLMKIYEDFDDKIISKNEFIEVLELIQSFTWRRFIVGLPTNALNKIFMRLYEDVDTKNYVESIKQSLIKKKGNQRFPTNPEVLNALKERDMYTIKPKNRTYFFERLENFQNKEYVNIENNENITIEHIFPQNPDPKWKKELGEENYKFIKENYLNTIANLTLSGNNGKLGNKTFLNKKDMNINSEEQGYKYSRLWLNRYLTQIDRWDINEINERFKLIVERFFSIWKYPEIKYKEEVDYSEVNIFDAEDPTGKKLEYAIFFDQQLEIKQVSKLYHIIMETLFDLQPKVFFTTDLVEKLNLTKNPQNCRKPVAINETYYIESNIDNKGKFDRIKKALTILDSEDELFIKYQD